MGWKYKFNLDFGPRQTPGSQFAWLASAMLIEPGFGALDQVTVYEFERYRTTYDLDKAIVEQHSQDASSLETITSDLLQQIGQRFPGDNYLFEGVWRTSRYSPDILTPLLGTGWVVLYAFSEGFPYYLGIEAHPSGLVYEADSYRFYSGDSEPPIPTRNMPILLEELRVFMKLGVQSIHGLDTERSLDPRDHSLVYHHTAEGFVSDLHTINPDVDSSVSVTREALVQAANGCEHVEVLDIEGGLLVYNKLGTAGRLKCFYTALAGILKS